MSDTTSTGALSGGSAESNFAKMDSIMCCLTVLPEFVILPGNTEELIGAYAAYTTYAKELFTARNEGRISKADIEEALPKVIQLEESLAVQKNIFLEAAWLFQGIKADTIGEALYLFDAVVDEADIQANQEGFTTQLEDDEYDIDYGVIGEGEGAADSELIGSDECNMELDWNGEGLVSSLGGVQEDLNGLHKSP